MRVLLQRVSRATVTVGSEMTGEIGRGLLAYVGIAQADTAQDIDYLAAKISTIRLFQDSEGRLDLSVADVGGGVLVVSQFTLYAETRRGRRPSFFDSALPDVAGPMVAAFSDALRKRGLRVESGRFGANMDVESINDGPVSIIIDSTDRERSRRT